MPELAEKKIEGSDLHLSRRFMAEVSEQIELCQVCYAPSRSGNYGDDDCTQNHRTNP